MPIVLPIRGHLDSIKQLMLGDLFIGRGLRQRGLKKSLWCNPFKVSEHGRALAESKFEHHSRTDQDLNEALWQLSGARLVWNCRPGESCHADIIRTVFSERFPDVYDRDSFRRLQERKFGTPLAGVWLRDKVLERVNRFNPRCTEARLLGFCVKSHR